MNLAPRIKEIEQRYRNSLVDKAQSFQDKLVELNDVDQDLAPTVEQLNDMLHKLAGSAGMYGYTEISQQARSAMESCNQVDIEMLKEQLTDLMNLLRSSS